MVTKKSASKASGPDYNEQILNSLTSGVIAVDGQGHVITANRAACEFLQVKRERLSPGERLESIAHAQPFLELTREVRKTGQPIQRREIILSYPDGTRKEIGLSASLLQGPEEFNGVIFLFVDMTERRKLERAAELSHQLATIGELTAGVVHELRNPVSVIRGMAELLMRKLGSDDDRGKTAKIIYDEAQHLQRSIAQFLSFARPFELEPTRCTADEIVERALQLSLRQAQGKGVHLRYVPTEGLPELRADPARVAQALANIISNAADAVDRGGEVVVSTRREGPQMIFEIVDDGPGIHLEPGEDLFQPFFTRKEDGTGLGLAIVHRIITAHHGSVLYGNRECGGARFEVRIPVELGSAW